MFMAGVEGSSMYLSISSFALTSIILIIGLYFGITTLLKLNQMKKFKEQNVQFYEGNKFVRSWAFNLGITIALFILVAIFFAIIWITKDDNTQIIIYAVTEIMSVILIVWVIAYLLIGMKMTESSIAAIKNNKLVVFDQIIEVQFITKIECDSRRKTIYVNWMDQITKGNVDQIKLKYNYKLKDFLDTLQVNKEWR